MSAPSTSEARTISSPPCGAQAEHREHGGGVDGGAVELGDRHGDAGRRGRADEDGGGAGVEALGPADVDAALSHVMLPFRILTVV